ncbi:tetratricopeptide repeat protein [Actinomadura graeca]|uniref:Tetratricopeptide repeat protein n=1 Tax=Actinomadura graeca TaxID=2750812 RepID=A0ABX8R329_9ACTN|nr:tetratricopeptide repeat protein [Actinomadura graeca]QXJ23408.1 tetratricopeptide repeat protein [Actinomadura graeca]
MPGSEGTERPPSSAPSPVTGAGERSIGAGRISGIASTGDNTTNIQAVLPPHALRPAAEVEAPAGLANVPGRHHLFVGRRAELDELDAVLEAASGVVVAAVHGLGGIGKSTLAARYAADRAGRWGPVWWITADTPQGVQAGLAALAAALQPALQTVLSLRELAGWALDWLACHRDWLLVLDNVNDPADVAPVMDRAARGRVLITSRLAEGWHRLGAQVVRLEVLTQEQAVELLTRIISGTTASGDAGGAGPFRGVRGVVPSQETGPVPSGAAELVAELGCLPLAVEQAAAFLHQTRLSPARYLELLRENPAVMYDRTARGADGERTVAGIWRITLDALAGTPLAGRLLRVVAWWAPEAIPRGLLDPLGDAVEVAAALGELAAYNMVSLDAGTVTVHRLVQAVARTPDATDPHRRPDDIAAARDQAAQLLNRARPSDFRDPALWPLWRTLLPHIDALAVHTDPDADTLDILPLLNWTAAFLNGQGAVQRAIAYYTRGLAGDQRLRGDLDPETLRSRNNLASAYQSAGDLRRAIPLYERTLAEWEQVLGSDHPDTLNCRNNLANALQATGALGRAIQLYERTLADRERVLGDDHPDTLLSRNNLAHAYQSAGDLDRSLPLYERTLADRERVLGGDHPDTLLSRNNLASAYQTAGDLDRAITLHEQTFADRERVLGGDHPATLQSRNNLAHVYQSAGSLDLAIPLYEQTLADRERVLGNDHPDTLNSRNNLAHAYQSAGDLQRAIPLYERTLADRERVLGDDHPDTLISRNNFAYVRQAAGDLGQAIRLYRQALADCERVLGADHPTTKVVRGNVERAEQAQAEQPPA